MPTSQPDLTRTQPMLDEQSFQGLLSAAFTIQEHNERRKRAAQFEITEDHPEPEATPVCENCGAPKPAEKSRCDRCETGEFRPGERLQRNWASMWLMSQEHALSQENWPESDARDRANSSIPSKRNPLSESASPRAASNFLARPLHYTAQTNASISPTADVRDTRARNYANEAASTGSMINAAANQPVSKSPVAEPISDSIQSVPSFSLFSENRNFHPTQGTTFESTLTEDIVLETPQEITASAEFVSDDATATEVGAQPPPPGSFLQDLTNLRVTLRFNRANLYLGLAVLVAGFALLWPAATAPRRPALGLWERALIKLGIAEAPAPTIHFQGDPSVQVWIDPHSALYYCPGEEQYGKAADGRFSTQREAQMDRFDPAGRSACE
jgi:ribosomal protein L40E